MDGSFDHIVWPLKRGDTLSNHDWFPFPSHKFLGSTFVTVSIMEGRRADIGTAIVLWSEAMRQDPAGTLPECDVELASLARFASVEEWLSVKDGVMKDWVPVSVEDDRTGEVISRLGNPSFLQPIVEDMHKRKRGRDGAREAARTAVRKTRIRKKMSDMKLQRHMIENDQIVTQLAEFFEHSDLYVTADNVRIAMAETIGYTGEIAAFPVKNGFRGD